LSFIAVLLFKHYFTGKGTNQGTNWNNKNL